MEPIRFSGFDVDERLFYGSSKKQKPSNDEDQDTDWQPSGRPTEFVSPSPMKDFRRPSNFNPFAAEQPSLISTSSTDISPEAGEDSFGGSTPMSNSSPYQKQLCKDFRKTLSFVEMCDGDDNADQTMDSPSTPPASASLPPIPKTAGRNLRFHHRAHQGENPTSRFYDEFEILGKLGGGSFGNVYRVRKRLDGCMYAVKIVNQAFLGQSGRERVLKEVYALAAVVNKDNAHIVRYFSSWIDVDDRLYIQTELCDRSLEDMLKTRSANGSISGTTMEEDAINILRQLLHGLNAFHSANVVHLDIKPANILVKNGTYKLGDLGHVAMARLGDSALPAPPPLKQGMTNQALQLSEEQERQVNAAMAVVQDVDEGDVRYMPRELLSENYDHLPKADIFSLAASVYEIFLNKPLPANGQEWLDLRQGQLSTEATSKMSPNFRVLMGLMLHPDPARRPSAEILLLTGGPGQILMDVAEMDRDHLRREVEHLRGLHPAHAVLKRSNTM